MFSDWRRMFNGDSACRGTGGRGDEGGGFYMMGRRATIRE